MPRYFFTLRDHVVETDDEGVELADAHAARIEAIRYAGEVLRDEPQLLDGRNLLVVEVSDAAGGEAFRLEMRAVGAD